MTAMQHPQPPFCQKKGPALRRTGPWIGEFDFYARDAGTAAAVRVLLLRKLTLQAFRFIDTATI
jgi:hypothetical protein